MLTNKDYCDYETCVALRELGYDDSTDLRYNSYGSLGDFLGGIKAPTLYEAQKWLREEKGVIVEVFVDDDSDTPITYNIHKDGECVCHHHGKYWTVKEWSEALSEGIKEAVKILKEE